MSFGRPPKYDWDAIRSLALAGTMTLSEIAAKFHIPCGTLTNRAVRENWQLSKTFGRTKPDSSKRQLAKVKAAKSIELTRQTAADVIANNASASRLHLSGAIRKAAAHLEQLDEDQLINSHQALQSVSKAASNVHGWNQPDFSRKYFDIRMLPIPPRQLPDQLPSQDQSPQLLENSDQPFRDIQP